MKVIDEIRDGAASPLGAEPVIVRREGKISGVYVPLDEPDRLSGELRGELIAAIGRHLARLLDAQEVTDERIAEDFRAHRRSRR